MLSLPITMASRESGIFSSEKLCFKTLSLSWWTVTSGVGEGGKTVRNGLLALRVPPVVSTHKLFFSTRHKETKTNITTSSTSTTAISLQGRDDYAHIIVFEICDVTQNVMNSIQLQYVKHNLYGIKSRSNKKSVRWWVWSGQKVGGVKSPDLGPVHHHYHYCQSLPVQ